MDGLSPEIYDSWKCGTPEDEMREYQGWIRECEECGRTDVRPMTRASIYEEIICRDCASRKVQCVSCERYGPPEDMILFEDEQFCPGCAKEK